MRGDAVHDALDRPSEGIHMTSMLRSYPRIYYLMMLMGFALIAGGGMASIHLESGADAVRARLTEVLQVFFDRGGVALGSDMDGGFGPDRLPRDLEHPAHLERLADRLRELGVLLAPKPGVARLLH